MSDGSRTALASGVMEAPWRGHKGTSIDSGPADAERSAKSDDSG